MNDDKNRKLGKLLKSINVRYGDPFVLAHANGDGKVIAHSVVQKRLIHPMHMIDVFCYYSAKFPNEYNNSLQLYDINTSNLANEISITRSPAWVRTAADRIRVDEFLDKMTDMILNKELVVVPLATAKHKSVLNRFLELIGGKGNKLGDKIKV